MTGFGRAKKQCAAFDIAIDVSSVNKKGFELSVSLPREWAPMERLFAQLLKKSVARGKVSVSVKIEKKDGGAAGVLDADALAKPLADFKAVCEKLGAKFEPTPELLLKLGEMLAANESAADWEESWAEIEPAANEAVEKLDAMRITEGAALKTDLKARLSTISALVADVENSSRGTVEKYREQLLQRLANSGLQLDPNDERVLKEICIFADKCDICEEITRLKSHIAQFLSTLEEPEAVGRKMDFICQEMGREINTIASKANSLELTKLAIDLKNELERIREQTQNVE